MIIFSAHFSPLPFSPPLLPHSCPSPLRLDHCPLLFLRSCPLPLFLVISRFLLLPFLIFSRSRFLSSSSLLLLSSLLLEPLFLPFFHPFVIYSTHILLPLITPSPSLLLSLISSLFSSSSPASLLLSLLPSST
jgi:hypothetical protein